MLPPADCAGIAAGRYTPDHIHPHTIASSNYGSVMDWVSAVGDWVSAVGDSPPESWFVYLAARIPANTSGSGEIVVIDPANNRAVVTAGDDVWLVEYSTADHLMVGTDPPSASPTSRMPSKSATS